jgi:asparagine synthase (glutamine-hydrolysing)
VSGFVAVVNLNGEPVDKRLLASLTSSMAFRGPDGQRTWAAGQVGLGCTLLKATYESQYERQPFTFDGIDHIVADCRIDDRAGLVEKLRAEDRAASLDRPDVELILHSWHAWGEACVQHLLGDFAFVIWNSQRRQLFGARDHLGVRSFFYARSGQHLIVSNTLECVRRHPAVSGTLNDLAIADFLLFGMNQDPETTWFDDVYRLPPAHMATWTKGEQRIDRYWTLPVEEPVFFRRAADYTDRFNELLETAVTDRLRFDRAGVFMSGGLDSSSLAAVASRVLRRRGIENGVHAFTTVIDGFDRNERHYSQLVADRLKMPIRILDRSQALVDPDWHSVSIRTSDPPDNLLTLASDLAEYQRVAQFSPVCFYGEGPDNALTFEWRPYLAYLARNRRWGRLASDVVGHIVRHRRVPLVPTIPRMIRERRQRSERQTSFPHWLQPAFSSRLGLRERWEERQRRRAGTLHPTKPRAYDSFTGLNWERLFRSHDAELTRAPLEVRNPYVDLRFLRFLLRVPAVPWCRSKYLMRQAMKGELPAAVLRRPKSSLSADPWWAGVRMLGLPPFASSELGREYVDSTLVPCDAGPNPASFWCCFQTRTLNRWLSNVVGEVKHHREQVEHEVTA